MRRLIILLFLALATPSLAAPPPGFNPDGARAKYFKALQRKTPSAKGAIMCCDEADCRAVDWKIAGDHYEVFLDDRFPGWEGAGKWVVVPPDAVITDSADPEGEAIACWSAYWGLLCFNPAGAA